ncbi:MAG: hypothetical protein LBF93_08615 [Zoogloeaceae bacterium]|nr:hypothetical protein [Zoogloeaceae bacterium]
MDGLTGGTPRAAPRAGKCLMNFEAQGGAIHLGRSALAFSGWQKRGF